MSHPTEQESRDPSPLKVKRLVRIDRLYTPSEIPQFSAHFPASELSGLVEPPVFQQTLFEINERLRDAFGLSRRSALRTVLGFTTLYCSEIFLASSMEAELDGLSRYLADQNKNVYRPLGIYFADPRRTAFLHLDIIVES
ncbi:Golgin subfamily A member 7/ERF4 [Cladochytrium replicatum]|nr:Golgin subfamily A member 7/ERF4 [Cladochytrium replicatum]